ncbi:MAG TPA: hypothetical protein VFS02_10275, partial [Telluria sp.]|nr:hypothetical protein [Telluria sp.]
NTSLSRSQSISTDLTQNQSLISFVLTRQFERKLNGSLELRHNQGSTLNAASSHYRENAISASLSYQL